MDTVELRADYEGVFDQQVGFGQRPALLIVDFVNAYIDRMSPFFAPGVVSAVGETVPLLDAARDSQLPVIFTRNVFHASGRDGGMFLRKVPALREMQEDQPLGQVVSSLEPNADEIIVRKQYPSAFFGTSLASLLFSEGVDTVILAGCTTSGCIRATAIDAVSYGFRLVVPRECVGDRRPEPHEANLFDIDSKYGDVVDRSAVIARLTPRKVLAG